jgi:transcriptional regulator GlxA family with amidase domain
VVTARRIGMSHRTLARKLSSEGLSFSEISEELKVNLAKHYLRNGDLPISQVAWLTEKTPSQPRAYGKLMPVEGIGRSRGR